MRQPLLALLLLCLVLAPQASAEDAGYDADLRRQQSTGIADAFRRFRAYAFFDQGYAHARNGNRDAAIDWLARGLARDPRHDAARFDLILLALAADRPAQARDEAIRLIKHRPHFAAAYLLRGLSHLDLSEQERARADIAAALGHGGLSAAHHRLAAATLAMLDARQATPTRPPPRLVALNAMDERLFKAHRDLGAAFRLPVLWPEPVRLPIAWPGRQDGLTSSGPPTDRAFALNNLGYRALAEGDIAAATQIFERSVTLRPGQSLIHQQLGYLYRAQNHHDAAAQAFRTALDADGLEPRTRHALRREVASLEDSFDLSSYAVYREQALSARELSLLGNSLAQSQGGVEAAWRPWRNGNMAARRPALFGRLLWGFEDDSIAVQSRSVQAGIGVRALPLPKINLVASVERLIAVGRDARDDWMARLSYSAGAGYEPSPFSDTWWHWHFYGDLALIDPADPDLLGAAEGRLGRGFNIAALDGLTLTPFIGVNASIEDAIRTTSLVETGPGLWLRYWFNENRYAAPRSAIDLRLEYRFELAGDSSSGSGLMLTFAIVY